MHICLQKVNIFYLYRPCDDGRKPSVDNVGQSRKEQDENFQGKQLIQIFSETKVQSVSICKALKCGTLLTV